DSCAVINVINRQSPDIAKGVDTGGAGDQGMMFGYACTETDEYMPAPIYYSHKLLERLADIRKNNHSLMPYLRPDAKAQVSIEYNDNEPVRITTIVLSTQHKEYDSSGTEIQQNRIKEDLIENVVKAVIP